MMNRSELMHVTGRRWLGLVSTAIAFVLLAGCQTYTTPGGPADFRAMGITAEEVEQRTDAGIAERLERQPLASFPVTLAVVRVQQPGYRSRSAGSFGDGRYSVVTVRDIENDADYERVLNLNMINRLIPLNRMVIPNRLQSDRELREAAASVHADMLLVYTVDTAFGSESKFAPLSTFTIGLFPEREARVTSTVSAAIVDTRNGYVYGLTEATAEETQLANAWTSRSAVEQSRRRAERKAFDGMLDRFEDMWSDILALHKPAQHAKREAGHGESF
jgi:hypothetical protein